MGYRDCQKARDDSSFDIRRPIANFLVVKGSAIIDYSNLVEYRTNVNSRYYSAVGPHAPEVTLANLARLLRQERESLDMSVYRLAKKSGLSQQTIHNIENGTRNPTLDSLLRIASALGVDLPNLIRRASRRHH